MVGQAWYFLKREDKQVKYSGREEYNEMSTRK